MSKVITKLRLVLSHHHQPLHYLLVVRAVSWRPPVPPPERLPVRTGLGVRSVHHPPSLQYIKLSVSSRDVTPLTSAGGQNIVIVTHLDTGHCHAAGCRCTSQNVKSHNLENNFCTYLHTTIQFVTVA